MIKRPTNRTTDPAIAIGLIVAAGAIAYGNSLGGPFVYDDQVSITQNPTIRHLWDALRPPQGGGITVEGRPVLNLSLALNYAISGPAVWSYHLLNLIIHLSAGLALFGIVRRTLEQVGTGVPPVHSLRTSCEFARTGRAARPYLLALAVALLWTVHPLQTESVTYVIQRAESLMGLFYLLTVYGFVRYAEAPERGRRGWAALSVAACFLGAGTKEVMVSAPIIVLLFDRAFFGGSLAAAWRERRGYYIGLACSWIPLALLVIAGGGNRSGSVGFGTRFSWSTHALTQFEAVSRYLRLSFWPHPLIFDYGVSRVGHPMEVIPAAALVAALLGATLWALRFRPALGLLGVFFFGILAPTSLLPGATQMIVEHRMYLPLAAVIALAAIGAARVFSARIFGVLVGAAAVALAAVTFQRNTIYRTEMGLWADTASKCPDNGVALNNLGLCLSEAGRDPEAIEQFRAALRTRPDFVEAHNNLGISLDKAGQTPEAIAEYGQALAIKPDWAEAHYNLGVALDKVGRVEEAIAQYAEAVRIKPDLADAHHHFGIALDEAGRTDEAIAEFKAALQFRPDWADARYNLGVIFGKAGRLAEAAEQFEQAVRLAPEWAEARYNLGVALLQAGKVPEAITQFEQALRIRPGYPEALAALQVAGQGPEKHP